MALGINTGGGGFSSSSSAKSGAKAGFGDMNYKTGADWKTLGILAVAAVALVWVGSR